MVGDCPSIAPSVPGVPVLLVAVLLPVAGLLVGLLAVPVVAGHLGVPLVVLVAQTVVVHPVVLLKVLLGELAAFGAFVLALVVVVGPFGALLRDFHLWRQMWVPKRVQVQLAELELFVQS